MVPSAPVASDLAGARYSVRVFAATVSSASYRARSVARFAADFRRSWQPASEPALADLLEWIGQAVPLNPPEAMDWLRQGLRQMLVSSWPAAGDSGS